MSERYDPFGRPIEGDHPWAKPAEQTSGLPGGFLPPESPTGQPVPAAQAAPVAAPELPASAGWATVGTPAPARPGAPVGAEYASWGSRGAAYIIDLIIEVVLGFLLSLPLAAVITGDTGLGLATVGVSLLVTMLYPTVMLATRNGRTLGDQALGIRVVGEGGSPITWGRAAMREIVMRTIVINLIGSITFGVVPVINLLWPLWDKENRALHDHGADTWVVRA